MAQRDSEGTGCRFEVRGPGAVPVCPLKAI